MIVKLSAAALLVTAVIQGEMWRVLLADALGVVDTVATQPGGVALSPHDIVRGLCRQAIDNALRSFVTRAAVHDGRSPEADLAALDEEDTTRDRIACVRRLLSSSSSRVSVLDDAAATIDAYLTGWNRAAHGNEPLEAPNLPSLRIELRAAERACQLLTSPSQ